MGILRFLAAFSVGALCTLDSEAKQPVSPTPVTGDNVANHEASEQPSNSAEAQDDAGPKARDGAGELDVTAHTAPSVAQENEVPPLEVPPSEADADVTRGSSVSNVGPSDSATPSSPPSASQSGEALAQPVGEEQGRNDVAPQKNTQAQAAVGGSHTAPPPSVGSAVRRPEPEAAQSSSTILRTADNQGGQTPSSSTPAPSTGTKITTTTTTTTTTLPEQDAGASGVSPALTGLTTFAIAILGSTAVAIAAL